MKFAVEGEYGGDILGDRGRIILTFEEAWDLYKDLELVFKFRDKHVVVERTPKPDKVEPGPVTTADLDKIAREKAAADEIKRKLLEEWEREKKDKPSETWFPSTWPVRPSPSVPGPKWEVYPSPGWAPTSPWTPNVPDCPGMTITCSDTLFSSMKAPDA